LVGCGVGVCAIFLGTWVSVRGIRLFFLGVNC